MEGSSLRRLDELLFCHRTATRKFTETICIIYLVYVILIIYNAFYALLTKRSDNGSDL